MQPNNFVHPLRISYANEYLYRKTKDSKYLKQAKTWVKKARKTAPSNQYVNAQLNYINALK